MKKKTIIIILILTLSIYALNINVQSAEENNYRPNSLELTPHNPIEITSDSDFEVFPGTGTAEDPYIIESYNITTMISRGISITDTTKHFIVRNCYVDAEDYGIFIIYVASGTATIINNTCNNNHHDGIYLSSSSSSLVANNTCSNNSDEGICLQSSGDSTVTNNTCNNNTISGIYLSSSSSSTVANNTCSNNKIGIYFWYSGSSTVANNTCSNNNRGIVLHYFDSSTVINNTCNNNSYEGISLGSSCSSIVVNNTCSNNNRGIYLRSSDFCVITYNLLQENGGYGVSSSYSDNNSIFYNTFVDNNLGGTDYGGSSQAYDEGRKNTWYDPETKEGNYWSDLGDKCTYKIDGKAHSKDLYPLNRAQSCPNPITMIILSITLPLLVSVAILAFVVPKYFVPYTRNTIIPYTRNIIIPYLRKRKEKKSLRKAKLLSCPNCSEKIKFSSTFCETCGTTFPKRKGFVLNRKMLLLYKSKLEESSDKELMIELIINIVIVILFVAAIFGDYWLIFWGAMLSAWVGEPGLLIGGCILALILIITLIFFIIPRFTALRLEKKTRRRKK